MAEGCYRREKGRNLTAAGADDLSTCTGRKADCKALLPLHIVCMHSIPFQEGRRGGDARMNERTI